MFRPCFEKTLRMWSLHMRRMIPGPGILWALLVLRFLVTVLFTFTSTVISNIKPFPIYGVWETELRLAFVLVLQSLPGAVHLMAPICGSWTRISRGTSWRSCINAFGDLSREWVREANCMVARYLSSPGLAFMSKHFFALENVNNTTQHMLATCSKLRLVLVMLLSMAVHAVWVCEQPEGSSDTFPNHVRFSWLCNRVAWVSWWVQCASVSHV